MSAAGGAEAIPATMRQWICTHPPEGEGVSEDCLALRELPMLEPGEGEALVRVRMINLHSATRSRMLSGQTAPGETDRSNYACGEVVRSRDPSFREGDVITCQSGWQDWQIVSSADAPVGYAPPSEAVRAVNRSNSQWTYVWRPELAARWGGDVLLDVFGTSGLTAWFGMRACGPFAPGDAVAVAGATGSVGAMVVQLARIAGCRVAGFARGEENCRWVRETLGADACIDYTAPDRAAALAAFAPEGLAMASDGVGGAMTELLAGALARGGRLLSYGSAAAFYGEAHDGPRGKGLRGAFGISPMVEEMLAARDARAEAWIVDAFYQDRLAAEDALSALLETGELRPVNTVVEGFEAIPAAIAGLYRQPHRGKLQVRF